MILKGPKWLAMGSKWAHFTCLCTPNGLGSFLEKHILDPLCVPKQPIFKAFGDFRRAKTGHHELKTRQKHLFWHSMWSRIIFEKILFFFCTCWTLLTHFGEGPKLLNMGSKWAHFTCLCTPNSPKVSLEKHIFDPFLNDFLSRNSPFSRHFVILKGPKWLAMGSKWAHFTCLCTPNGLGSFLEKHILDPFCVPKQPIFKAFGDFRRAKTGHHELKTRQKHLFWHSMWSRIIFEKIPFFCTRWTLLTHFGTHLFGLPLAPCRSPPSLGMGV